MNGSQSILKLGLASVIITGATLLVSDQIRPIRLFGIFGHRLPHLLPYSRGTEQLAALFYLDVRIDRMKEMEELPTQQGRTDFKPENYDISFDNVNSPTTEEDKF